MVKSRKQTHSLSIYLPRVLNIRTVSLYYPVSVHPLSTNRLKVMKRTLQREVITKVRIARAK